MQKTYEHEERKVEYGNIVQGNFLLLTASAHLKYKYTNSWHGGERRADSRRQVDESYSILKNVNDRAGCPALVVKSSPALFTQVDNYDKVTIYSPLRQHSLCTSRSGPPPPPIRGLVWHDDLAVLVGKTQSNMSIPKATHTIMST